MYVYDESKYVNVVHVLLNDLIAARFFYHSYLRVLGSINDDILNICRNMMIMQARY